MSDVTQGGLDSCQVCELVGLYLLQEMKTNFPMLNFGLYRDDGLACHKRIPGPTLEKHKKDIIHLFHENDLKITIETGMKSVDFLDITLDLNKGNYKPYKKTTMNSSMSIKNQITLRQCLNRYLTLLIIGYKEFQVG